MLVMFAAPADAVEVAFPAETANMVIARTVAAAVAARADLTVDQIEDVRLAIDEAIAYLIAHARADARVRAQLWADGSTFHAALTCTTSAPSPPEPERFSETVLTALVGEVDRDILDGDLTIHWSVNRDHSVSA